MSRENIIFGRNPVVEAMDAGREMEKIVVCKGSEGSIKKIIGRAKASKIYVQYSDRKVLDRIADGQSHQGIIAYVSSCNYVEIDDILKKARSSEEPPFIIVLDNIEDPHNLGAIMRTAECAGAHGVIIPKHRSAGITEVVVKASAGATEYLPCARVSNIAQTLDRLKDEGLWITACDMDGGDYRESDLNGAVALVIGSEGFGISRLVREKCDFVASIPLMGRISSLNASNAAAVLMYEVRRRRDGK